MNPMYCNPFRLTDQWEGNQLGDPFVMRFDGRYYLYCSSHKAQIKCWRSDNLVDWQYIGSVCDAPEIDGAYAPEVIYYSGAFYMVTSPKGSGHYLLRADSPEGPFELISENFGLLIDGSLFVDNDGEEYLFRAGHRGIVAHKMPTPNFPEIAGETINEAYLQFWTEGPMVVFRDGYYFLTYTGNHLLSRGYRIAYSVSATSPLAGYVNMDNRLLMLETGDEFHALGHSSTVLGPDLDSYFMAYHSFNFCIKPAERSLNIDRILFNRARMRVNAAWWPEEAPKMPCVCLRGEEGRQIEWQGEKFTAEWNVQPKAMPVQWSIGVVLEPGKLKVNGTERPLPKGISFDANLTLRAAYENGELTLYVNNLYMGRWPMALQAGKIEVTLLKGQSLGFVGISDAVNGSYDYLAQKSVPGSFDAVHCLKKGSEQGIFENGMEVKCLACATDTIAQYRVNVKKAGEYSVFARLKADTVAFNMAGRRLEAQIGERDERGFAVCHMGCISLQEGEQIITLSGFEAPCLLDTLEFIPYAPVQAMKPVENGFQTADTLEIIGHKRQKSMIHKYSGFTCAENLGLALAGSESWTDYRVKTTLYMTPEVLGHISVYLRATRASWFSDQVRMAIYAYRLMFDGKQIALSRCEYDETPIAAVQVDWTCGATKEMTIEMKNDTLNVYYEGNCLLAYKDSNQMAHGKVGFDASGEGQGVLNFLIEPM
jgi:Beta-xylosidase